MTNLNHVDNRPYSVKKTTVQDNKKVSSVEVGKDILDLLAAAMYIDPLNIFREYIQNSADAIDEAKDVGLLKETHGKVEVTFNYGDRSVVIRDNGIGVSFDEFPVILTNIGSSHKRGKSLRGFRGIGRLSGLGYCQELIFRSRTINDCHVHEIKWNGRELRRCLRDPAFQGGLAELIQSVVSISELSSDEYPAHFFEVELRKISRLKNDLLLNDDVVRDYLAQVTPVPFSNGCSHGKEIQGFLKSHGIREPIHITVNGENTPIYHKLSDRFIGKGKSLEKVHGVEYIEVPGFDGDVAAIGWICDHAYSGAIPKSSGLGGIRLKAGNIQVGDETVMSKLFPEARFSNWAIGEIHIISPKILPNGRRDEFEPSMHYSHLQDEFAILMKNIAHQIREKSSNRNQINKLNQQRQVIQKWVDILLESTLPMPITEAASSIVCTLSKNALNRLEKTKAATKSDIKLQEKVIELEAQLQSLDIDVHEITSEERSPSHGSIAIEDVTKLILENTTDLKEGISLAMRVVNSLS